MESSAELVQLLQDFARESRQEYERTQQELKEIDVLIRQSSNEVENLSRQNTQAANRLNQMEANLAEHSPEEISDVFSAAYEAQRRLFMGRSQVEQLQIKQQSLERYAEQLRRALEVVEGASQPELEAEPGREKGTEGPPLVARVIEAQENERKFLARQMHDGPAQSLTNLMLQAEICERLFDTDPAQARTELGNLKNAVNTTFQKTKDFIFDLRPMMLDDLGLFPTLRRFAQDFEQKTGLSINLTTTGQERRLASYTEVTIFRAIQELLKNIHQHAQASRVQITLEIKDKLAEVNVEDNGRGFNVAEALSASRQGQTVGLAAMKERVEMLGGSVQIGSSRGRGTRVKLQIPAI
ncbi:MAG: ATP-binding protein [Anaerolineae bacterium]